MGAGHIGTSGGIRTRVRVGMAVALVAVAVAACGGGGGSSDPTVLRAGQIDIKLPAGYKVVDGKVVDETATTVAPAPDTAGDTTPATTPATSGKASTTTAGGSSSGSSATATTKAGGTATTKPGATASTKPTGTTIVASSSNPQSDMMSAFGKFRACLDRDGVKFIGGPDQSNPDSPTNDPDYLKSLSKCAAESNIVAALKSAQDAQQNLTPEQIKTQNTNYLKWRKCMISRGWKVPMPKPDAQGRLVTFGAGQSSGSSSGSSGSSGSGSSTGGITGPPGKDLLTSSDLSECSAKVQATASK